MTIVAIAALASLCIFTGHLAAEAKKDEDAKAQKVTIKDLKFDPAKLTIKKGETVVWTNKDDSDHTINAKDKSFESDNLGTGDKFRHTFDDKGEFSYYCKYHPRMKGVVIVKE